MKVVTDPNNPARFKDDATAEELRLEIMRRALRTTRATRQLPLTQRLLQVPQAHIPKTAPNAAK